MSQGEPGAVMAGARLVWRRQRVLGLVYSVNLLLALPAALRTNRSLGGVLNNSLASERLAKGFDLTAFLELLAQPEVSPAQLVMGSVVSSFLFFVFFLFATGGVLEVYRRDQSLGAAEFFAACGGFFWRFVRLLLFLVVALVPAGILAGLVTRVSGRLASDAPREMLGFGVEMGGFLLLWVLLVAIRLWFDMAQVRAVAEGERAMRRTLWRALKLTGRNFGSLFWLYLRISLVAWAGLALAAWVWVKFVPAGSVGLTFLLGQAVVLLWLATRLWQRASETLWYQRRFPPPASVPADAPSA
jgi:hypothetical protein